MRRSDQKEQRFSDPEGIKEDFLEKDSEDPEGQTSLSTRRAEESGNPGST